MISLLNGDEIKTPIKKVAAAGVRVWMVGNIYKNGVMGLRLSEQENLQRLKIQRLRITIFPFGPVHHGYIKSHI